MDDYDWMNDNQSGWTDHSSHPSTNVNYANEYDLSVQGWLFQDDNYKAGVIAGYQETRFSWTATGGSYNYDNGATTGNFPTGERGIGYSQRFSMPISVSRVNIVSMTLSLMPCLNSVIGSELMITTNTICVS
jgi:plasminogen activator